ncbi:hypothetical protein M758_1G151300 [Ceratodon purpureus]|nr:hypothetical protein M758_1G151300 [Ceratodon purpureus]KAG0630057.1 hypothetical protein M758_1G151300 [Ceratodon purpureus]KAG0630058.1 hypothetical protein M758_1G151300 [Ceratodon purpureus]KAG0630059.1 hypothetical protein M758_1G151300 [Ceratodon purpureus]
MAYPSSQSHVKPRRLSMSKPAMPFSKSQYIIFFPLSFILIISLFMFNASNDELNLSVAQKPKHDSCEGRRIFIYQLPTEFNDRIALDCQNYTFRDWSMCDDVRNDGLGNLMNLDAASDPAAPLLQPSSAWYKTDQFSLEVIFHRRLLTHTCRTEDPAQASMFYLPFYHTLDVSRNLFNPDLTVRDHLTNRFVSWLRQQEPWQLHHGHRHVLTLGRIIWDFYRHPEYEPWGSSLLRQPELGNVTTLLIERCTYGMSVCDNAVAIPYPTNFHPASDAALRSWQTAVRNVKRTRFITFAGSARSGALHNMTGTVRGELFTQCAESPKCKHLLCTQELCADNVQTLYKLYSESVFCLQPAGDSPTRKGIFDTLLSGCIPVVFARNQTVEQYLWHLPGNGSNYSVQLDGEAVAFDHYDVMGHLERIPKEEVERLQESIVQLIPRLLIRNHKLEAEYTSKDAIDVAIESLFEWFERGDPQK